VYGRQSWRNIHEGQENCYLLTNGLGGFSALTMVGSNARNDHALLISCDNLHNQRYHLLTNLAETAVVNGKEYDLHSQEFGKGARTADGYKFLNSFVVDIFPTWRYLVDGLEIVKSIAMRHGRNAIAVKYELINRSGADAEFEVTPLLQFVPKGDILEASQEFEIAGNKIASGGQSLLFETNGQVFPHPTVSEKGLYYYQDERDGRDSVGNVAHNHSIKWHIKAGERKELYLNYDQENLDKSVDEIFADEKSRVAKIIEQSGLEDPIAQQLVAASDQFIIEKQATNGLTIVAGYPFFMDWGRDTMIALQGCGITTRRFEETKSILQSFMDYCHKGLMPNIFPEGTSEPRYNTVDAALLFINVLWEYYQASGDLDFIKKAFDTAKDIIHWYRKGTDFSIKMNSDGLISAGGGDDQVTWMDVNVDGILPTPRHGKPVEINAYWYSALKIMSEFAHLLGKDEEDYLELSEKVKASFLKEFWSYDLGCLKDLASGTPNDNQIRCNQIWAVSVPFTTLDESQQKQVVDKVFEYLYTPVGLRSLAPIDHEFHHSYGGTNVERDLAYHQGTVWGFPLGAYYLAYLKAYGNDAPEKAQSAINDVKDQLQAIEPTLREGCIGQIAEIFDGEYPAMSRGCFAQAWSVGEVLRVFRAVQDLSLGNGQH